MVLSELAARIQRPVEQIMKNSSEIEMIEDNVLDACLNEIALALLQADCSFDLVRNLKNNIKTTVKNITKPKIVKLTIFRELCKLLDSGKPCLIPQENTNSLVMFVGLQGSGKTNVCTQYAHYYKKRGWQPALIHADTFRASAFDQLMHHAIESGFAFHGSFVESDPVKIAVDGVESFKDKFDLVLIDTSDRHKEEATLFEETIQIVNATKPDLVIFVMDGTIGQAAFDQVQAFKQKVMERVAIIFTRMEGHSNAGGALSAVAAANSPVIFIETGEQLDEFEAFDVKPFVCRLLGMEVLHNTEPVDQQAEFQPSKRSFRKKWGMYKYLRAVHSMIHKEPTVEMAKPKLLFKTTPPMIMVTFTDDELDNPKLLNCSRIVRIAKQSGFPVIEVIALLKNFLIVVTICEARMEKVLKTRQARQ